MTLTNTELLRLDASSGLSFRELSDTEPKLAAKLTPVLDDRLTASVARLIAGSEKLREAVGDIGTVALPKDLTRPVGEVARDVLRAAIGTDALAKDPALREELAALEAGAVTSVAEAVGVDQPIRAVPDFGTELSRARVHRFADAVGLPAKTATALGDLGSLTAVTETNLEALVEAGTLTAAAARKAGTAVALYDLFDEREGLMKAFAAEAEDPVALTSLPASEWKKRIVASGTVPVGGMTDDDYAGALRAKVDERFRTSALARDLTAAFDAKATPKQAAILDRRYRGLGIGKVLDDPDLKAADRVVEANRRIEQANEFLTANPGALELNLLPGSADVSTLTYPKGADETDRKRLLAVGRGYQRAFAVAEDLPMAKVIVEIGLGSATAIAETTPEKLAKLTNYDPERIARLIDKATGIAVATGVGLGTIIDASPGGFTDLPVSNVAPDVADFLKELPGYEDFFGTQGLCDCTHCRSVLGPAAYFVDLMAFIDTHVTVPVFGSRQDHDLMLRTRRPDLWDRLELTCENASEEIPYLVIVNEILEDAVARDVAHGGPGASFNLPFTELATYIRHFDRSLADLAEAGGATGGTLTGLRLHLPPEDLEVITTSAANGVSLSRVYGLDVGTGLAAADIPALLGPLGVDRHAFDDLVGTQFVGGGNSLALPVLDRLHRFARLWRATGWRTGELDIVRTRLQQAGHGTGLDEGLVSAVAHLRRLGESWDLPVEELVSLCADLPDVVVAGARPRPAGARRDQEPAGPRVSLLDRLFNQPSDVAAHGAYPNAGARFTHPALAIGAPAASPHLHRLLAGLGVDEGQLYHLILGLAAPLGVDPASAGAAGRAFPVTLRTLSLLYRHARLARALGVGVPELFALCALSPTVPHGYVDNLADLDAVVRTARWVASSRWTVAALVEVCDVAVRVPLPVSGPPVTPALELARQLVAEAAGAFVVADTDPPAPAPTADDGAAVLRSALPGKLGLSPSVAAGALDLLGINLAAARLFAELRDATIGPVAIAAVITRVRRLGRVLAGARAGDAATLDLLTQHRDLFGIADFDHIGLASLRRLDLYRSLIEPWHERGEVPPDLAAAIVGYVPGTGFAPADLATVAAAVGADEAFVASLRQELPQPADPFAALEQAVVAGLVCRQVGAPAVLLRLVQSTQSQELTAASALLLGAMRARHPDPADFERNHEPYRDIVLSRQRDALVAYLLHSRTSYPFDEVSDLYHYYLLDPLVEGVVRISRVAAGIASAQLYVQRCVMNLEETARGHADPIRVSPSRVPRDEWRWRQNYRVWEANRKAFLFPESYLEPELRDDKTPLFRQLEEELLSKPVTEEAVRAAYGRYLRGFDELAGLRLAGSFHERNAAARRDVLHLFGTTADEPPVYYYRRIDDVHYGVGEPDRATRWGPWERLDLQIPTRTVSPLVHSGQLYLFWVRYVTRSINQFAGGNSRFAGYSHRAHVEFTTRRLDGSWAPAQQVGLTEEPFVTSGNGIVLDPLVARDVTKLDFPFIGQLLLYSNYQPLHDRVAHDQPKDDYTLSGFGWDRIYPSSGDQIELRGINFQMWSKLDLYTRQIGPRMNYDDVDPPGLLKDRGVPWFPPESIEGLAVILALLSLFGGSLSEANKVLKGVLESAKRDLLWSEANTSTRYLHAMKMGQGEYSVFEPYVLASLLLEREKLARYEKPLAVTGPIEWTSPQWHPDVTTYLKRFFRPNQVLSMPSAATVDVVNGAFSDVIVQNGRELFHVGLRTVDGKPYLLRRLSTGVSEPIARTLFNEGLDALLATPRQLQLGEPSHQLSTVGSAIVDRTKSGTVDFDGPMGTYLREIYFHIPFLLADHLNSLGEFEAAQRWYHYVFDPTSSEVITGIPAGASDEERRRRELDRVWRYRELRKLNAETLRERLTNGPAVEAYKRDPFNPHAIARLRLTAYQKALVMRYVDNLLDWGDHLFALAYSQSNPEYIREATLKYVLAQDLLGPRPASTGACADPGQRMRLADILGASVEDADEFLVEIESLVVTALSSTPSAGTGGSAPKYVPLWHAAPSTTTYAAQGSVREFAERTLGRPVTAADRTDPPAVLVEAIKNLSPADLATMIPADNGSAASGPTPVTVSPGFLTPVILEPAFMLDLVRMPMFCVPRDEKLGGYWDRVEDRLFKVRNSLDPDGTFRRLPLFAPPIDPGLLVRAKAEGLGAEDALGASAGGVPPFRFSHLIERARGQAAALQQFGSALLSAHERRDGEELATLRNTHERNLHKLTLETRRTELEVASVGLEQARRQRESALYRYEHAAELLATGLIGAEIAQTASRATAIVLRGADAILNLAAGIAYLVPQIGSPFAMKYGGKDAGDSFRAMSDSLTSAAALAEIAADVSGTVAGFERRAEGWRHDLRLAENELKVLDRDVRAAELRRDLAVRALDQQVLAAQQHDEVLELYRDKFSGLGLYTYMGRSLQLLHRQAYGNALAVAHLAEQAYRFELPGDDASYVGGEWDGARSGLLAGERLTLALATLERRYLERYDNSAAQIPQSFSLRMIDPAALIELRETGSCELRIPEFAFDLLYPGQYRRQIRAVQLSIPSVRGPYTNVSATLTLLGSRIRSEPVTGAAALVDVPVSRTERIATSSAQSDSGRFELSFGGQNLNPFEGAGAISDWRIELPTLLRAFDYATISDAVLTISYTARYDGALRATLEDPASANGQLAALTSSPLPRAFSLRRDFPGAFERLLGAPTGTAVDLAIAEEHLPYHVSGMQLAVSRAELVLDLADGPVGAFAVELDGFPVDGFPELPDPRPANARLGGLPAKRVEAALRPALLGTHSLSVSDAGGLAAVGAPGLDRTRVRDIILLVSCTIHP
ncbi:MAG: hypothetical protein IPJ61_09665 [Tessaracoccus sp.]|uniref:Tc toxin subunit A-related protein n=1 Tax=Tessaracoccus sp. TaxID=1971211 RepID=UPI001EBEB0A8|nr:neuraminidase-like domain-containing protein [Tessaracoccus sp.]MBK7821328.1 hypothetical protein [Tessaracoccus sp.]